MLLSTSMWRKAVVIAGLLLGAGVATAQSTPAAPAAPGDDPVLVERNGVTVTRKDFEAELMKMPADIRGGFVNEKGRIGKMVQRLIVQKSLARDAEAAKLGQSPDAQRRIELERERVMAQLYIEDVERRAEREFDATLPRQEARAREIYAADRRKYEVPEQVSAAHILFDIKKHSKEEGQRLANDAYARLMRGADFDAMVKELSEDPSAKINNGQLGWFDRKTMDPAFAQAAFGMSRQGEISPPVLSTFGWHIIRFQGRRPQRVQPFEEVKDSIVGELRKKYVNEQREAVIAKVRDDPDMKVNIPDIDALYVRPDTEAMKRAMEAVERENAAPPVPK
jgi:peptidyl-prolyl cis-trans isomerase C